MAVSMVAARALLQAGRIHELLNVKHDPTNTEIKKAYRKLAVVHHPDKGGDENKFKELTEAYEVLSDKDKREKYDTFGKDGLGDNGMNINPHDIFNQFFGGFGGWCLFLLGTCKGRKRNACVALFTAH